MDTDVVVIGAGAAGLAAAVSLAKRSARVIVLEARDRIGGRVFSTKVGAGGPPADLGAEFIHGIAPQTSALLREAGFAKVETGDGSWLCGPNGTLQHVGDDFLVADLFKRVASLDHDESVDAFLRRFENDRTLREEARRARAFVEGFEAADPALASVRAIAEELRSGTDESSARPVGTYAPLFAYLAAQITRLAIDMRLGTPVERVDWKRGGVMVTGRRESGETFAVRARCAIVTVPAGVLQQGPSGFTFEPPLPPEKQSALAGLAMGHVVRVVLAFRTPFWETIANARYRDAAFFRCENHAFNAFWTQLPLRTPTIVAWAGGPRAAAMDALSIDERIDCARETFGELIGEPELTRREYAAGCSHDWSSDPFARGAYSYVITGATGARTALGAPVENTLFFAGEATATDGQGGTVSGAFATGERAAKEAAAAFTNTV